jgi:hypothetical protein
MVEKVEQKIKTTSVDSNGGKIKNFYFMRFLYHYMPISML